MIRIMTVSLLRKIAIAIVVFTSLSLLAQTDLTGFWVFRVPTGDGNFRETFFQLKQTGENITGKLMFGNREIPITAGTYKDGKLHFETTFGTGERARQVSYDGTVQGDKIDMTSQSPGREPRKGLAERTTEEATKPPAKLPLPSLHDIPDNALVRTPPMGWNSWNKFAGKVDDKTIRDMADAMVSSGMKDAGYIYVNIDDTWEGQRDAQGNITSNTKFPDMKALTEYVHSKGLKIGLYSSPGPKTCAGYEGSYGHEEQDAQTYSQWGFDYLKYDWCSASQIYKNEEMQAVYQKMGDALRGGRDRPRRPMVFSLCQYGINDVWMWGTKVGGNLWRTTGDISDNWASMSKIGFTQFDIAPYIRPGHWNDPDMLEIGNGGMNADEYRTHMSLWSMLAAPLLAGNDLRTMTDETKSILMNKEVIAIDQDPDANPARRLSDPDATAVIVTRLLHDGSVALGLFNKADQERTIDVKWDNIGLARRKVQAHDLWKHADVQVLADGYSTSVPAHGVVLLKLAVSR